MSGCSRIVFALLVVQRSIMPSWARLTPTQPTKGEPRWLVVYDTGQPTVRYEWWSRYDKALGGADALAR